jgi:hypothetical protein
LIWHLSNELGEPESFGWIHKIVHNLARSREAKTSERVILSWVMMTAGKVLSGERTDDRIQADQKG